MSTERLQPFYPNETASTPVQFQPGYTPTYPGTNGPQFEQGYAQQGEAYGAPQIPINKHKQNISGQRISKNQTVLADHHKNCMILLSEKNSQGNNGTVEYNSPYIPSNLTTEERQKTSVVTDVICAGTVEVISVDKIVSADDNNNMPSSMTLLIVSASGEQKSISKDIEILNDKKEFEIFLAEQGVIMSPGKPVSYIVSYLRLELQKAPKNTVHKGYYSDEQGIHIEDERRVLLNSLDSTELPAVLGIHVPNDIPKAFYEITIVSQGIIARFAERLKEDKPDLTRVIVFKVADCVKAENELADIFCVSAEHVIIPEKDFRSKLHMNSISFIKLSDQTDHKKKRTIQQTINYLYSVSHADHENPCDTIVVIVIQNDKILGDYLSSEQILVIPYSPIYCGRNAVRIADLFQSLYLKDTRFLDELKAIARKHQNGLLSEYDCDEHLIQIFSWCMAILEMMLTRFRFNIDDEDIPKILEQYCEFLINIEDSADGSVIEILRDFLAGDGRDILIRKEDLPPDCNKKRLIGYNDSDIYITPPLFNELAENNNMKKTLFAQRLKEAGILSSGEKYQRNVALTSGQARLYDIKLDKLFEPGQIKIEPYDFADCDPGIMIEIGLCGSRKIYFSTSDRKGTDNGNIFVSGSSGTGKSYFLKKFAHSAAAQDIEVVVIGTEDTCPDFNGECDEYRVDPENLLAFDYDLRTILAPLLDGNILSDETKILAEMLVGEKLRFHSIDKCIEVIKTLVGDEKSAQELIEQIQRAYCCGVYSNSFSWENVCQKGRISIVKSTDDDKTFLDSILRSFYDYKCSRSEISPCLLILDECQSFDLNQDSALIDMLLRRGRKRGIMTVLSSQYLTAANGRNINKAIDQCDTIIAMKPGNSPDVAKRVGISVNDDNARSIMAGIGKYSCIARGRLSTDRCMIDYPLIIRIPK